MAQVRVEDARTTRMVGVGMTSGSKSKQARSRPPRQTPPAVVQEVPKVPPGFRKTAEDLISERGQRPPAQRMETIEAWKLEALIDTANAVTRFANGLQRWACAQCTQRHQMATFALSKKLMEEGMEPGQGDWDKRFEQAIKDGQLAASQGLACPPDALPAARLADLLINGTAICSFCFAQGPPPQEQQEQPQQGQPEPSYRPGAGISQLLLPPGSGMPRR